MPDWKPTPLQALFVQEYKKDHNGTQAVLRAGFSANGARVTANRLLTHPNIKVLIAKQEASIQKRNHNIVDRIVAQYETFAFDEQRGTADKDRIHALDSLSRIAGINRDSLNLTNSEQEPEALNSWREIAKANVNGNGAHAR